MPNDLQKLKEELSKLKKGSIILIDVDDTIITHSSNFFRLNSPYRETITLLKQERSKFSNFEDILGNFRLKREVMLVWQDWPEMINSLKSQHLVYALTKLETGKLGPIPSIEEWRYNELKNMGIIFSPDLNLKEGSKNQHVVINFNNEQESPATFHKGIFFTGNSKKGEVTQKIIDWLNPSHILFIDDRKEQIEDVRKTCQQNNISFSEVWFRHAELLPGTVDHRVAKLQHELLIKHGKWLEDEEAVKYFPALNKEKRCMII